MTIRLSLAKMAGAVSTWGLKHIARRPAANLPGKIALKIDPMLLDDLRDKCCTGSVIVVGTNGKTSTNNLVADAFEAANRSIICNRTGANLAAGVASALLQQPRAQWGVFECDELWLAHVLPHLRSRYVLLLNLFRDQLDRCGEIDRIQTSLMGALAASPETVLIYNADDPLCARIALEVPNPTVAFGLSQPLGLAQNTVADAQMCQQCDGMIAYHFRQYGQLGDYYCEECDFARPPLDVAGCKVKITSAELSLEVCRRGQTAATHRLTQTMSDKNRSETSSSDSAEKPEICQRFSSPRPTPYDAYNLVAAWALCLQVNISPSDFQRAVSAFNPHNGRLQRYRIDDHKVLLNLAKNPTGFNQNLKIVTVDDAPKIVAFFINDKVADGHDISWIWDIDFEELADQPHTFVIAGGTRAHDLQVRLKYAGVPSVLGDISDAFAAARALGNADAFWENCGIYAIANYTALPPVHDALDKMEASEGKSGVSEVAVQAMAGELSRLKEAAFRSAEESPRSLQQNNEESIVVRTSSGNAPVSSESPLVIAHLLPDLLNLYGDGGNVRVLAERLRWRGIPVEVRAVHYGETVDLTQVDLVFMGGGPDREQKLASEQLLAMADDLRAYVEADGPLLAICGGYQILGRQWLWGDELVPGLGILAMETRRPGTSADRLIDNMVLQSPLATHPVVGYENHAGRTYLDAGVEGFGRVVSPCGHGNNDDDRVEGALYRHVVGTYSHGPLLSKNPEVADWLLARALERHAGRTGNEAPKLVPLDDAEELAANATMVHRLKGR